VKAIGDLTAIGCPVETTAAAAAEESRRERRLAGVVSLL